MSGFKVGDVVTYVGRDRQIAGEIAEHECTVGEVSGDRLFVHVADWGFLDNSPESQWRHVPGDVTATSPDVPEMKIFVLSADEIIRLSDMAANADRYGRTFRVAVDDTGVKFKVGEGTWTWAYGTKEEQS